MAEQKIVNLPEWMTVILFSLGFVTSFFFTTILLSYGPKVKEILTIRMAEKVAAVLSMMWAGPVKAIIGGALMLILVIGASKSKPFVYGLIVGLTSRAMAYTLGFEDIGLVNHIPYAKQYFNQSLGNVTQTMG